MLNSVKSRWVTYDFAIKWTATFVWVRLRLWLYYFSKYEDPRNETAVLVNKMIVSIWPIHCDCMLSVRNFFTFFAGPLVQQSWEPLVYYMEPEYWFRPSYVDKGSISCTNGISASNGWNSWQGQPFTGQTLIPPYWIHVGDVRFGPHISPNRQNPASILGCYPRSRGAAYIKITPSTFWNISGLWLLIPMLNILHPRNAVSINEVNDQTLARGFRTFRFLPYSCNRLRCYLQVWRVPGIL